MEYETTPTKNNTKDINNKLLIQSACKLGTGRLLWIVITRHRVGLLIAGNVLWFINWAVPMWFSILKSLV